MKTERRYCYECGKEQDFQICSTDEKIVARGSSQPHIVANGYAQLSVWGKVIAKVSAKVSVLIHGDLAQISGGKQTKVRLKTSKGWCDYYGVEIRKGIATLFKAIDDDYSTPTARTKNIFYKPGDRPSAPDWDGGKDECGGGLHASCHPLAALRFNPTAKKFVALPVRLKDFKPYPQAQYPDKVKFEKVAGPVWEVDRDGNKK